MPISQDTLEVGETFDGETGLRDGAQLEDLVAKATPKSGSEMVDQSSIETYADGALGVSRFRVKAGGISNAMLGGSIATSKLANNGLPNYTDTKAFDVYNAGSQSIPASTATKVVLDTEVYDPATTFDAVTNSRWVPGVTGIAQVHAAVGMTNMDLGRDCWVAIYKNGVQYGRLKTRLYTAANSNDPIIPVSGLVLIDNIADYIELYVRQASTTSETLTGGKCFLSGMMIATLT